MDIHLVNEILSHFHNLFNQETLEKLHNYYNELKEIKQNS